MKKSNYNYVIPCTDGVIFFNGIKETFFLSSHDNKSTFEDIIDSPNSFIEKHKETIDNLISSGFIIEDNVDEFQLIKDKYHHLRKPGVFSLMILPTYQCNLRCWYCIQDHQNIKLSKEIIENIKKRIFYVCNDPSIKQINLSWFGGEPTLELKTLVEVTEFSFDICKKRNISFTCDITTNGTLVDTETVDKLRSIGVNSYQITIDGPKDYHNKIKMLKHVSAFDKALSIIDYIAQKNKCTLRLNYSNDNLLPSEIIQDLESRLSESSKPNIFFHLCNIWQENPDEINEEKAEELIKKAAEHNIKGGFGIPTLCYADNYHFECIMPDGHVGKCDNEPFEQMPGILSDSGTVDWNEQINLYSPSSLSDIDNDCLACQYYPFCWGPCPSSRAKTIRNIGKPNCKFPNKDSHFHRMVKKFVLESLVQNKCLDFKIF